MYNIHYTKFYSCEGRGGGVEWKWPMGKMKVPGKDIKVGKQKGDISSWALSSRLYPPGENIFDGGGGGSNTNKSELKDIKFNNI